MQILQTDNLMKIYPMASGDVHALDGVTLQIDDGQFVAIVGSSGSGKTTLLHLLGGLDVPTSGSVIVRGKNLSTLSKEELTIFRRRNIGFVFQKLQSDAGSECL